MAVNLRRESSTYGRVQNGIILDFSRPGKPTDNAFIESFSEAVIYRERMALAPNVIIVDVSRADASSRAVENSVTSAR